jgi:hypothetical protein
MKFRRLFEPRSPRGAGAFSFDRAGGNGVSTPFSSHSRSVPVQHIRNAEHPWIRVAIPTVRTSCPLAGEDRAGGRLEAAGPGGQPIRSDVIGSDRSARWARLSSPVTSELEDVRQDWRLGARSLESDRAGSGRGRATDDGRTRRGASSSRRSGRRRNPPRAGEAVKDAAGVGACGGGPARHRKVRGTAAPSRRPESP